MQIYIDNLNYQNQSKKNGNPRFNGRVACCWYRIKFHSYIPYLFNNLFITLYVFFFVISQVLIQSIKPSIGMASSLDKFQSKVIKIYLLNLKLNIIIN